MGLAATATLAAALSTLASSGLAALSTLAASSTLAAPFALAAFSAFSCATAALTPTTFLIVALTLPLSWVRHFTLLLMLSKAICRSNHYWPIWFLLFLVRFRNTKWTRPINKTPAQYAGVFA